MTDTRTPRASAPGLGLDLAMFIGCWTNTNTNSNSNSKDRQFEKVVLRQEEGQLAVRIFGSGHPQAGDWGETFAEAICADSISSRRGMAFLARYDLGSMQVNVGVNLNQGLLVLAIFNTFKNKNNDRQANYFAREFFCQ